jgi:phage tail protein X
MTDTVFDRVTVKGRGVRLDAMIAKRDRAYTPGLVETALDLNVGLAARGVHIPAGTVVDLPRRQAVEAQAIEVVRLWD